MRVPGGGIERVEVQLSYCANGLALLSDIDDESTSKRVKPAMKLSNVKTPSQLVTYFDGGDDSIGQGSASKGGWDMRDSTADNVGGAFNQIPFEVHHKIGNNFAYLDTHVDLLKISANKVGPYKYGLPPYPSAWVPNASRYKPALPSPDRNPTQGR
jgi:hypothetical protein